VEVVEEAHNRHLEAREVAEVAEGEVETP